jgi:hypothetical protein
MKKTILALLLTAAAIPTQAQFQSVTATANGTLHSPTNFWTANSLALAAALAANPGARVVRRITTLTDWGNTANKNGVWFYAGENITLGLDIFSHTSTIVNAGTGSVYLDFDGQTKATILPGETVSYSWDHNDESLEVLSRWTPAPMPGANGLIVRTSPSETNARTITGTAGQIVVTNGDGVSGNPTISLPSTITGNRTFADNLTVQGNTTLGDAAGDTLTISGTITAANANGTAAGSIANVGTLDARYGFAAGQTAAVSGNMRYAQGTTGGRRLFGTVANMANSTETKLFSATSVSNNLIGDTIGNLLVCFNNGNGSGVGSALIFYRGNQGAIVMQQSPTGTFAADGPYWISFTANLTLNTGDLITGNSSGATARVWRGSGLPGSVSDVWLYDVTGIFTSADTNLSINDNPSGVGVSNTAFGPSPAAGLRFFLYVSRLPDGTRVPAIFHRQGNTLSVLYDYTGF